jgi:hypothetical protein
MHGSLSTTEERIEALCANPTIDSKADSKFILAIPDVSWNHVDYMSVYHNQTALSIIPAGYINTDLFLHPHKMIKPLCVAWF